MLGSTAYLVASFFLEFNQGAFHSFVQQIDELRRLAKFGRELFPSRKPSKVFEFKISVSA